MNWKAALLLFVIFFASAVTTVAVSLNVPRLGQFGVSEKMTLHIGYEPLGDPIGGPGFPY